MRLRLVPFVPAAIALGGCYLYRDPAPLTPVLVAAALPRAAAIEDLDSLVAIIGEVHPNPGPRLGPLRDSLARVWPDTIGRARIARDLGRLLATIGDGHTAVSLDGLELRAALERGERTWPFSVRRSADGIVIANVVGADTAVLRPGDRLEAIAGRPIDDLVTELGLAVPAELPTWRDMLVLRSRGGRLWQEGVRPPAVVRVTGRDGRLREVPIAGATMNPRERQAAPAVSEPLTVRRTADSVLVLNFERMWGDQTAFRARLDSAFDAGARDGVRAVVVDLRRNGGGDSRWGTTLLSYVTAAPLSEGVRKEWKGSRRYRAYIASRVTPLIRTWLPFSWMDGPVSGIFSGPPGTVAVLEYTPTPSPANPRRLERPTCILIGPGTFSSAMMLANTARRSGVATLIGEPTGEPPNSGGEVLGFVLRRSGIVGQVSSAHFVLDEDPAGDRRGVLPHVEVVPTREDIAARRDPVMERAMACGRQ
ncbi:MAG: S41 family peptidase [Gemmatimonadota bacterium]